MCLAKLYLREVYWIFISLKFLNVEQKLKDEYGHILADNIQ